MTSAGAYLNRLMSATDDDTTWAVTDEVVVMEGIDGALRYADVWGESDEPEVRAAALDVLACASREDARSGGPARVVRHAARVTPGDDRYLRWSAAHALAQVGSARDKPDDVTRRRAARELLRFAADEDECVRWHVANGLPALLDEHPDPTGPGVEALLRLLRDPDAEVRDWAAFAFRVVEVDSPRIRTELLAATEDPDGDGAAEASLALAERGDVRVRAGVLAELDRHDVGNLWVEAATVLPSLEYLPALRRLAEAGAFDRRGAPTLDELHAAIVAAELTRLDPWLPEAEGVDDAGR